MKVDKNKKYYKVVDEKGHFGLNYRLGLNRDPLPFNDNKDECVKGGIHFSDLDNILSYFSYGDYVAEVEIPADAKVCTDDDWNEARADKIIINKMISKKDFVSWLIDSEQLNWGKYSWAVAEFCPHKLDPEKYNWKEYSWAVAEYCPEKIDPEKYNWEEYSWFVAVFCPEKIDTERFNWKEHSWAVAKYCPKKLKLRPKNKEGKNDSQ